MSEQGLTPFMRRLNALKEEGKTEVMMVSPVQAKTTGTSPLMGGMTPPKSEEELRREATRKQLATQMEGNRGNVEQAAAALRQQVASGKLSPAQAEMQMNTLVNKLVDNHYMGYGDLEARNKAASFEEEHGLEAGKAYGMYSLGADPQILMGEVQSVDTSQAPLMAPSAAAPTEGEAPLMGEVVEEETVEEVRK